MSKWWRYPLQQAGCPNHIYMMYMCSECKHKVENKTPYCPWCGADMGIEEKAKTKYLLSPDERADTLNIINSAFDENDIPLQAVGYEDDGCIFSIFTQRPFGYERRE